MVGLLRVLPFLAVGFSVHGTELGTCADLNRPCKSGIAIIGEQCCEDLFCYEETVCISANATAPEPAVAAAIARGTCADVDESCKSGIAIIGQQCCDGLACYEETACVKIANATDV